MKCEETRRLLVAMADSELAGADLARVEEHLAACPECARELAALRADVRLLRGEPPPELPAFLATRIAARISAGVGTSLALAAAAAAMIIVSTAGLWLGVAIGRGIIPERPSVEAKFAAVAQSFAPEAPVPGGGR
jgi:anti-sigma factor RsiW